MNEPISAEARFEPDGTIRPLAFRWKGKHFRIESHGRQWEESGAHHFLVMVTGDQVFELIYLQGENQWQLKRSPHNFKRHPFI